MKAGTFYDPWRGNGVHLSSKRWTIALRWRWRLALFVRPPGKPGYVRFYVGPIELELRQEQPKEEGA